MDTVLAESKQLVSEILSGPDYFTCERTHTRMKKEICVKRQTSGIRILGGHWKHAQTPSECMDCEQGMNIKAELSDLQEKEIEMSDAEATIICDEPGCTDEATVKGKCKPHYKKAYMKEYWKTYKKPNKQAAKGPQKPGKLDVPVEKPHETEEGHSIIMVDFADFPEILEQLEQQARTDIRSIENQVLYLVKRGLGEGNNGE